MIQKEEEKLAFPLLAFAVRWMGRNVALGIEEKNLVLHPKEDSWEGIEWKKESIYPKEAWSEGTGEEKLALYPKEAW